MRHQYKIAFSMDLCFVLPEAAKICDSVNNTMAGFGFNEKIGIRSELLRANLTVAKVLTEKEKMQMATIMEEKWAEMQPTWRVKVASFEYDGATLED